jgi:hypothetical protein
VRSADSRCIEAHRLEIRADASRQLSYLDPTGRQLHISCGIAIEFARLAIRSLGHDAVVRLLPDAYPGVLGTITIGRASEPSIEERRWLEAIPRRYTDRGAWLRVLDRPGERDTLLLLGSDDDTPIGWLRTGRALALNVLVLTDAGLVTQPLGQVTDVPVTRARLQRELGLLGHPQLLLRVGYGHGRPLTGRRSVDEVLSSAAIT